ncbi:MAG TPA: lipocalin-like domain-containing protein [Terriglobales bacterium]|nr:lipocalin-like domain-containing protein [Terriglobales bacterium]
MKKSMSIAMLLLFLIFARTPFAGKDRATAASIQNRLVGAWRLVSLEEPGPDGKVHKPDCTGQFLFTNDGRASVQVMYRNAQISSAYTQAGYEASYGSYRVDSSSTFIFHIDGALVRTLIGKDLKRTYTISANRLTVTSTDPNEHWKVIWESY